MSLDSKYYNFYLGHIQNLRHNSGNEYQGLCPFHEDKKTLSFSVNMETGLYFCHGCGVSGNAITFAKEKNIDSAPIGNIMKINTDYEAKAEKYHNYLLKNIEDFKTKNIIPEFWTLETILKTKTGYDKRNKWITFPHYDKKNNFLNIKWHKKKQIKGNGKNRIFPQHLIPDYSLDNPVIFCEGEKDCISLLSHGINAITNTTGAGKVPEDLSNLKDISNLIIVLDNDNAGINGSTKLAKTLKNKFPNIFVSIFYWEKTLSKGYDVTDFFSDNGTKESFLKLIKRAKPYIHKEQTKELSNNTYLRLYRKIINSKVFANPDLLKLWIYCLTRASHKTEYVPVKIGKGYTTVKLNPGQLITGRNTLAKVLNIKHSKTAKNRLEKLESMGNIKIEATSQYSIVTICKWEFYQCG